MSLLTKFYNFNQFLKNILIDELKKKYFYQFYI